MSESNKLPCKVLISLTLGFVVLSSRPCFAEEAEWLYPVRSGDTLIGISNKYLAVPSRWVKLQKLNNVTNPLRLMPRQSLRIPMSLLKHKPLQAKLVSISGNVKLKDSFGVARYPQEGELLSTGTQLITTEDSSATLVFSDSSVLVLQPNSNIILDDISAYEGSEIVKNNLRLQQGRVDIHANPEKKLQHQMQIMTPSAVAAVRGTQFRVSAEPMVSREETTEGVVAFKANGKEVILPAGFGSVAENGQTPSKPSPLLEAPDLSQLPEKIMYLPMRFDMPYQEGAVAWNGQIFKDAKVQLTKHSDSPRLTFADLPDGRYVLHVRSENAVGLQSLDASHTFELAARPFAPLIVSPANNQIVRNPQPVLKWTEANDISNYHFVLAKDANFQQIMKEADTETTQIEPDQGLEAGEYYWRVASINAQKTGPYSDTFQFSYKQLPAIPADVISSIKIDKKQIEVTLHPPADGMHYEAELAEKNDIDKVLWHGVSDDGKLIMPLPLSRKLLLSLRLVEADGTAGPYSTHLIEIPLPKYWIGLLLLVPFLGI